MVVIKMLEKLSKFFTWSIGVAIVLTIGMWMINYTPESKRVADTYYPTFMDHLLYGMITIFPIAVSLVGVTVFASKVLGKYSKLSSNMQKFVSVLLAIAFVSGVVWPLLMK